MVPADIASHLFHDVARAIALARDSSSLVKACFYDVKGGVNLVNDGLPKVNGRGNVV